MICYSFHFCDYSKEKRGTKVPSFFVYFLACLNLAAFRLLGEWRVCFFPLLGVVLDPRTYLVDEYMHTAFNCLLLIVLSTTLSELAEMEETPTRHRRRRNLRLGWPHNSSLLDPNLQSKSSTPLQEETKTRNLKVVSSTVRAKLTKNFDC